MLEVRHIKTQPSSLNCLVFPITFLTRFSFNISNQSSMPAPNSGLLEPIFPHFSSLLQELREIIWSYALPQRLITIYHSIITFYIGRLHSSQLYVGKPRRYKDNHHQRDFCYRWGEPGCCFGLPSVFPRGQGLDRRRLH
jgi:hypothetical protein